MLTGDGQAAQPKKVTDPKTGKEHNVPTAVAAQKDKEQKLGVVDAVSKLTNMTVTDMVVTNFKGVGRSRGSLGETGNLFENFGAGTMAMLHGKESVVTEDQMKSLIKGVQTSNIEGMLKNLTDGPKGTPGIDIGKMSQALNTSVSSMSPRTSTPSMGGIKSVAEQAEEKLRLMEPEATARTRASESKKDSLSTSDSTSKSTSLSDLGDKLDQLNKTMNQLVTLSAQSVETGNKQIKATKGLSGNLFA
jgi:hypothetical protein